MPLFRHNPITILTAAVCVGLLAACSSASVSDGADAPARAVASADVAQPTRAAADPDPLAPIVPAVTAADRIVNAAKAEAREGVRYDASYYRIPYPGGDVPADRGACVEVVIRGFRAAGLDLQKLIHQDMVAHFGIYPRKWHEPGPDSNIDHRRCLNQMEYLRRFGRELSTSVDGPARAEWRPGDLVYWRLAPGIEHVGVISNVTGDSGLPLVIHNLGVTRQEDVLTSWKRIGHFRFLSGRQT